MGLDLTPNPQRAQHEQSFRSNIQFSPIEVFRAAAQAYVEVIGITDLEAAPNGEESLLRKAAREFGNLENQPRTAAQWRAWYENTMRPALAEAQNILSPILHHPMAHSSVDLSLKAQEVGESAYLAGWHVARAAVIQICYTFLQKSCPSLLPEQQVKFDTEDSETHTIARSIIEAGKQGYQNVQRLSRDEDTLATLEGMPYWTSRVLELRHNSAVQIPDWLIDLATNSEAFLYDGSDCHSRWLELMGRTANDQLEINLPPLRTPERWAWEEVKRVLEVADDPWSLGKDAPEWHFIKHEQRTLRFMPYQGAPLASEIGWLHLGVESLLTRFREAQEQIQSMAQRGHDRFSEFERNPQSVRGLPSRIMIVPDR